MKKILDELGQESGLLAKNIQALQERGPAGKIWRERITEERRKEIALVLHEFKDLTQRGLGAGELRVEELEELCFTLMTEWIKSFRQEIERILNEADR
ncbi:MAG: hypothetical protein ACE5PO_01635 [Candidatus Bathyarchaeia archaeon]